MWFERLADSRTFAISLLAHLSLAGIAGRASAPLGSLPTHGTRFLQKRRSKAPAAKPDKCIYIWIDSYHRIRYGTCINICPAAAVSLRESDVACANCEGG